MRYLVALIIGVGVLFGINYFADLFSMPRPWGSLLMGATVGITMVVVLLIWEVVKPSNRDAAPAKPAMSEEERTSARADRRARLAAEAGVSLDDTTDTDGARPTSTSSAGDIVDSAGEGADSARDAEASDSAPDSTTEDTGAEANDAGVSPDTHVTPESDESSIEAEPNDGDTVQQQPKDGDTVQTEPDTLAPEEFDEEATGSSLENPPTGEPGVSVDALEDAEEAGADDAAEDGHVDSEPTTHEPDSKR